MARNNFNYETFLIQWNEFNPNMHLCVKDKKPISQHDKSPIICHCDICGGKYESSINNLITSMKRNGKFKGCRICSGQLIVDGINDLLTHRPDLEPYIVDKNEVKNIGISASKAKKIRVKCPNCGHISEKNIYDFVRYGISCPICADGMSIPNKFLRNVLIQKSDYVKNLIFEYKSEWTQGKTYDAYFIFNEQAYVVEIDGEQHFRDSEWGTFQSQMENDKLKNALANENNVKMIRINAQISDFEFMKSEILKSELGVLFDLSKIDWEKCIHNSTKNVLIELCNYFKSHNDTSTDELGNIFHISRTTVLRYLNKGNDIGLCKYDKEYKKKQRSETIKNVKRNKNKLDFNVYRNGKCIKHYKSLSECLEDFSKIYPDICLTNEGISFALKTGTEYHGFIFQYAQITLQDVYKDDELINIICDYYNQHSDLFIKEISEILSIPLRKITMYLLAGNKFGLCNYDMKQHQKETNKRRIWLSKTKSNRKRPIYVYDKYNNLIGTYYGYSECTRQINNLYPNMNLYNGYVSALLIKNGDIANCKGLTISKHPLDFTKERSSDIYELECS